MPNAEDPQAGPDPDHPAERNRRRVLGIGEFAPAQTQIDRTTPLRYDTTTGTWTGSISATSAGGPITLRATSAGTPVSFAVPTNSRPLADPYGWRTSQAITDEEAQEADLNIADFTEPVTREITFDHVDPDLLNVLTGRSTFHEPNGDFYDEVTNEVDTNDGPAIRAVYREDDNGNLTTEGVDQTVTTEAPVLPQAPEGWRWRNTGSGAATNERTYIGRAPARASAFRAELRRLLDQWSPDLAAYSSDDLLCDFFIDTLDKHEETL